MKAKNPAITQERLKELLDYNPDTGVFTWKYSGSGRRRNAVAGGLDVAGYVKITIEGAPIYAHRLVWLYSRGVWPAEYLDHIDGDKSNNRLGNLREATNSENQGNHRGLGAKTKNIFYLPNGRFRVTIQKGSYVYNKTVDTLPQAVAMANRVRTLLHGEFANHG